MTLAFKNVMVLTRSLTKSVTRSGRGRTLDTVVLPGLDFTNLRRLRKERMLKKKSERKIFYRQKSKLTLDEIDYEVLEMGIELFELAISEARAFEHYFPLEIKCFVNEHAKPRQKHLKSCLENLKKANLRELSVESVLNADSLALYKWMKDVLLSKIEILESPPDLDDLVKSLKSTVKHVSPVWLKIKNNDPRSSMKGAMAFHGSPAGNWFNIIRNGLKVMSGTKFQANGGKGIYCTTEFATAYNYTNPNSIGQKFVGIIQVSPKIKTQNIMVVPRSKMQKLRYLCIFS